MNTNTELTPDQISDLRQRLQKLGRQHAVSHFEKGNFLDSPNEEVSKYLDRNQIGETAHNFGTLYDAYCDGYQSYHVEKWIAGLDEERCLAITKIMVNAPQPVQPAPSPSDKELLREAREVLQSLQTTLQNLHNDFKSGRALHPDNIVFGLKSNLISLEPTLKKLQSATR